MKEEVEGKKEDPEKIQKTTITNEKFEPELEEEEDSEGEEEILQDLRGRKRKRGSQLTLDPIERKDLVIVRTENYSQVWEDQATKFQEIERRLRHDFEKDLAELIKKMNYFSLNTVGELEKKVEENGKAKAMLQYQLDQMISNKPDTSMEIDKIRNIVRDDIQREYKKELEIIMSQIIYPNINNLKDQINEETQNRLKTNQSVFQKQEEILREINKERMEDIQMPELKVETLTQVEFVVNKGNGANQTNGLETAIRQMIQDGINEFSWSNIRVFDQLFGRVNKIEEEIKMIRENQSRKEWKDIDNMKDDEEIEGKKNKFKEEKIRREIRKLKDRIIELKNEIEKNEENIEETRENVANNCRTAKRNQDYTRSVLSAYKNEFEKSEKKRKELKTWIINKFRN